MSDGTYASGEAPGRVPDGAPARFEGGIWRRDAPTEGALPFRGASVVAAAPGTVVATGPARPSLLLVPVALVLAAATAVGAGMLWARAAVATGVNIGVLAWVIGAATGLVAGRISRGAGAIVVQAYAMLAAAAGVLVGKYLVWVHGLGLLARQVRGAHGHVRALDAVEIRFYVHHFETLVRPLDALWVGLAALAAWRASIVRRR